MLTRTGLGDGQWTVLRRQQETNLAPNRMDLFDELEIKFGIMLLLLSFLLVRLPKILALSKIKEPQRDPYLKIGFRII